MSDTGRSYRRGVLRTSGFNASATSFGAATGILLARWLGPSGRGEYAVVTSWYGITLVVFELGLAAAVVYFVASDPSRAATSVRTALTMLSGLGLVTAAITCWFAAFFLPAESSIRTSLMLVALMVVVSFIGAPATFALQAVDLSRWNWARLVQPALYLTLVIAIAFVHAVSLTAVMACLLVAVVMQTLLAWWLVRPNLAGQGGHVDRATGRRMLGYGLPNLAATAPNSLNGRLDQVILLALVPAASLGSYAVAVSLSLLATPLVAAFGHVGFPHLASASSGRRETVRDAIAGSLKTAMAGVLGIVLVGPIVTPLLFGPGYSDVPTLLLILAPGAVAFMVNAVLGDLLRGVGHPWLVARAEWGGVLVTVAGLALIVPTFGVAGAAAVSSAAYLAVFVLLMLAVRPHHRGESSDQ